MIRTDAQLLHMSGPINDVDENVTEGLIGSVGCHPTTSCSGVAVEYTDRRWLVIDDITQAHVLEPLTCQLLDLPEHGSFAPLGRSNRHRHGGQSPTRRQRCAGAVALSVTEREAGADPGRSRQLAPRLAKPA